MISGIVNAALEVTLRIDVTGPSGSSLQVTAVIDTGYNGSLSLPLSVVTSLGLVRLLSNRVQLADLTTQVYDFYSAMVLWDGRPRPVRVLCIDGDPLLGTALLENYALEAVFKPGGPVVLTAAP